LVANVHVLSQSSHPVSLASLTELACLITPAFISLNWPEYSDAVAVSPPLVQFVRLPSP